MSKLARKNIFMSQQIANWYEEESETTGMSQSNLMVMALHTFMTQQLSIRMVNQLTQIEITQQKLLEQQKND